MVGRATHTYHHVVGSVPVALVRHAKYPSSSFPRSRRVGIGVRFARIPPGWDAAHGEDSPGHGEGESGVV